MFSVLLITNKHGGLKNTNHFNLFLVTNVILIIQRDPKNLRVTIKSYKIFYFFQHLKILGSRQNLVANSNSE